MYCGRCGQECEPITADFGHGRTEFWGAISVEKKFELVSDCCYEDLFEDDGLERQVNG